MGLGLGVGLLIGVRAATTGSLVLLLFVAAGLVVLIVLSPEGRRAPLVLLLAGSVVGWSLVALRASDAAVDWAPPRSAEFEGRIVTDPRVSPSGSRAYVRWTAEGAERRALLFLPLVSDAGRGDRVRVQGRVSLDLGDPMVFANSVEVLERAGRIERWRRDIRRYCSEAMIRYLPGSAGSLTLGLLIGDDTGLSSAERRDLRASGLAHITAVSGWNVSVVVASAGALFRALGARAWRWLAVQLMLLGGYVWIVGLEPPIVRAAIMGAVALVALQLGRPAHMLTLLTLTAAVMVVLDPDVLGSLSFHLSFLSMVGLAVAARICSGLDGTRAVLISPAVAASAAGLLTAPLLAASFGTLALMTVPANLLAGPLIPLATFTGILVVAASWISPVADVLGWLGWMVASVVLRISSGFAAVPGGHHTFAPLDGSATLTIYFGLALCVVPFFPEGRWVVRRLEAWALRSPGSATLSVLVAAGMLAIGVLAM